MQFNTKKSTYIHMLSDLTEKEVLEIVPAGVLLYRLWLDTKIKKLEATIKEEEHKRKMRERMVFTLVRRPMWDSRPCIFPPFGV